MAEARLEHFPRRHFRVCSRVGVFQHRREGRERLEGASLIPPRPGAVVEVPFTSPAPPSRHSIRSSLIALVAACLTPALLVSGYLIYENYSQHRARLERD